MTLHGVRLFPIGCVLLSAAIAGAQTGAGQGAAKLVNAADAAPAPPAAAPAPEFPKRPAELPPKPPKVICQGNQLTISADNSTLDAILSAVRGCTGARIDLPEGANRVRAFEELGPGPVREVIDELLSGSPYNYVIQSSEANPAKVEMVMLSMRGEDNGKPGSSNSISSDIPMTAGRRAWQKMQKFDKPDPAALNADGVQVESDAATPADEATAASAAKPVDATPAPSPTEPAPVEAASIPAPATPAVTPVAPPIVEPGSSADPSKAMQDRIAQMQQMFQQRQQMIQKQNQGQSGSPQ